MNKQLLKAANEAWLKGYDIRVVYKMHDKSIEIAFGKRRARSFKNFAKALSFFQAGLEFAEVDKALGAKRREEAGAEGETDVEVPVYAEVDND